MTQHSIYDKELYMAITGAELLYIQMFEKYLAICEYTEIQVTKKRASVIPKFQLDLAKELLESHGFSDIETFIDILIFYNDLKAKNG